MRKFIMAGVAMLLAACNPMANMSAADDKIAAFQETYSRGDDRALYGMVSSEFREQMSREQFDDMLTVLRTRLGPVEDSERNGFNVRSTPLGTVTVITMETQFGKGEGVETYTFKGQGEDMTLAGWRVASNRLVLTADDLRPSADESSQEVEIMNAE